MAFIDSTYFDGEIKIPEIGSGKVNNSNLTQAITQYEKEILISLLGYKLYSLLQADLSGGIPQTQKYIDLVDGKEYTLTCDGVEHYIKWNGLKNTDKTSLIAYYVFFKYLERDVTRFYGSGIAVAAPDKNGGWERASAVNKLCNAWERMRELYGKFPPVYRAEYDAKLSYGDMPGIVNADASAYNFLYTNQSDYPDWKFTPLWNINAFGI